MALIQQNMIAFSEYGSTEKNVLLNWDASREQMKQDRVCLVQKLSDLIRMVELVQLLKKIQQQMLFSISFHLAI